MLVTRLGAIDDRQLGKAAGAILRVHAVIDRELCVFGGHLLAIVKFHSFAQPDSVELAVLRNLPSFRQCGLEVAFEIDCQERLEHQIANSFLG